MEFTEALPEVLKDQIKSGIALFSSLLNEDGMVYHRVELNCGDLPDPVWRKGQPLPQQLIDSFFSHLPADNRPGLYCFEVLEDDMEAVLKAYRHFKYHSEFQNRASPALKKNPPTDSRFLYVGKGKKGIGGRMAVHLGYYHVLRTGGLQLVCWAKAIELKLRLHVYSFPPEMAPFVSSFELPFARALNPMIGKH